MSGLFVLEKSKCNYFVIYEIKKEISGGFCLVFFCCFFLGGRVRMQEDDSLRDHCNFKKTKKSSMVDSRNPVTDKSSVI